jgi:hypothetical protein
MYQDYRSVGCFMTRKNSEKYQGIKALRGEAILFMLLERK